MRCPDCDEPIFSDNLDLCSWCGWEDGPPVIGVFFLGMAIVLGATLATVGLLAVL